MKLKFDKNELLAGINAVQGVTAGRNSLPILSNLLIKAEGESITLSATDLEVSIESVVEGDVIEAGAMTVGAKKLGDIVRALPDEEISLSDAGNDRLELTCGVGVYKMVGLPADEFPASKGLDENHFIMDSDFLVDVIDKTVFSASTEDARYMLNGLYFDLRSDMTAIVGTDGRRLAVVSSDEMTIDTEDPIGVIVPLKAVKEVSKVFFNSKNDVKISLSKGVEDDEGYSQIVFSNDIITLASRLVEGEYPKYDAIIPTDHPMNLTFDRDVLLGALRRVSVMSNPRTFSIRLDVEATIAKVSSKTPELGEAVESFDVAEGMGNIAIAFDSRFMLEAVANINDDKVIMVLKDSLSAVVIKPANTDDKHICLIMPMRIE